MVDEINVLVLAYLGDSVYEIYVREHLIKLGIANVNDLQRESINYVSAKSQAKFLKLLIDENYFNEKELSVIKRGRNYKSGRHPKNCDVVTYKYATAFETLIGYWYLNKEKDKIYELMVKIFNIKKGECIC